MADLTNHERMIAHLRRGTTALEQHVNNSRDTIAGYLEQIAHDKAAQKLEGTVNDGETPDP